MIGVICLAFLAAAHAVPLPNQQGNIPDVGIPYEIIRNAPSELPNENNIRIVNLNELRGAPFESSEADVDNAILEELSPEDVLTAIKIAAALEQEILRHNPNLNSEINEQDVRNIIGYIARNIQGINNDVVSNAKGADNDLHSSDLYPSAVEVINNEIEANHAPA